VILLPLAVYFVLRAAGHPVEASFWPCVLVAGLPGVVGVAQKHPVLTDAFGMFLMCVIVLFVLQGWVLSAALLSILAASVNEKAPVFAALASWSVVPLVGCLLTIALLIVRKGNIPKAPDVVKPLDRSLEHHKGLSWEYVGPWGAMLPLALLAPVVPLLASLGAAYGQIAIANDTVRLYQWAFLALAMAIAGASIPSWLFPPLCALHWFHPWQRVI
jgi:hypothetical protein